MDDRLNSTSTSLLNEVLQNNSAYAKSFDKPMSLGVKKKVCWICTPPTHADAGQRRVWT